MTIETEPIRQHSEALGLIEAIASTSGMDLSWTYCVHGQLLHCFIDLNNLALSRFFVEDRQRIGHGR